MLRIHPLTLGLYQTNTYIIHDNSSTKCCIIDPGYEPQTIMTHLKKLGLEPEAILLTHGHFDHVGGVKKIAEETGCRVFIHAAELTMPPMFTAGKLYFTDTYDEGDVLHLSGLDISVLHTPGHTPGSVCLLVEDFMFSGDTLFEGSCGRTDLPGGDWNTIQSSLARLAKLEKDYTAFPGHGGSTTLAQEKKYNPYMR